MTWKTKDQFYLHTERYKWDHGEHSVKNGFSQIDTGQEAPYFGLWANPQTLVVAQFCEGDYSRSETDSIEEFCGEVRRLDKVFGGIKIDPFNKDGETCRLWKELSLGDLLHDSYK